MEGWDRVKTEIETYRLKANFFGRPVERGFFGRWVCELCRCCRLGSNAWI